MHRRKKLKTPVLSRLTWAWLGMLACFVGLGAWVFHSMRSGQGAGRIALPVEQIEVFARAPLAQAGREERIAAPALRDTTGPDAGWPAGGPALAGVNDALAGSSETQEGLTLIYPDEDEFFADADAVGEAAPFTADDVVITIAGGAKAASVTRASLTPAAQPIPEPDAALLRSTPLGQIPRIAPDGRKAFQYYARPFNHEGEPRIAIVVGGLGLNAGVTERAIDDLPPEISLSFAPYAKNLEFWTHKARQAGHEVLIELPMENYGANSEALGAAALLTSRSEQENLQRLEWLMARFGAYVAATNYLGGKFSADEEAISPVLAKLKAAGVGYIDDTGAAQRSPGAQGLPMATVSRIIPAAADNTDLRAVKRELAMLEQIAERDGMALGKTYAYAATIDEIVEWSKSLERKGFSAAPASAVLRASAASR